MDRRKILVKIASVGIILIVSLSLVFVFVIHPSDSEVELIHPADYLSEDSDQSDSRLVVIDHFEHSLDSKSYGKALAELAESSQLRIAENTRHRNTFFRLVTVDRHPWVFDAKDAIYLPKGEYLRLELPIEQASRVEFMALPAKAHDVDLTLTQGRDSLATEIEKARLKGGPIERLGRRKLSLSKIFPDDKHHRTPWSFVSGKLTSQEPLQVRCSDGCFITRPQVRTLASTASKINSIIILVDTLRADGVNKMPTLSEYASASINYQNHFAPGNMTAPSANAILNCRPPSDFPYVTFSYSANNRTREKFAKEFPSPFAATLKKNNYKTAMIGNISILGDSLGRGVNYGYSEQIGLEMDVYDTPLIANESIKWLARNKDQPFHLYIHFHAPHAPYRPPLADLVDSFESLDDLSSYPNIVRWLYRGELRYTDRHLARILTYLEESGLSEKTHVIITSDHGESHTEMPLAGNQLGRQDRGLFLDHGATMRNDEVKTPLIIKSPGVSPYLNHRYTSSLEIGGLILDALNVPVETSHCYRRDPDDPIKIEGFKSRAVITPDKLKYIRSYVPTQKRLYQEGRYGNELRLVHLPEQVFDLENDPDEQTDISDNLAVLKKVRHEYQMAFADYMVHKLIIHAEDGARVKVKLPLSWYERGMTLPRDFTADIVEDSVLISGALRNRIEFVLPELDNLESVSVNVNEKEIPLKSTSLGLPRSRGKDLPVEYADKHLITPRAPEAQVVSTWNRHFRGIELGDNAPEMEEILREWGYLNDQ